MKLPVKVTLTVALMTCLSLLAITLIAQTVSKSEQQTKQDKQQEAEAKTKQKPVSENAGTLPTLVVKRSTDPANSTQQSKKSQNAREATREASVEAETVLLDCRPFDYFYFTGYGEPNTSRQVIMRQTNPGVLGYSNSSQGPYTPELTITLHYNNLGQIVFNQHYVTATQVGQSTMRTCYQATEPNQPEQCSDWFSFNVKECVCPDIPILP